MAGHCIHVLQYIELSAPPLILWEHSHGKANIDRRRLNYLDMLRKYTDLLDKQEIRTSMLDRDVCMDL